MRAHAAVVLAAGGSRRLGRPKQLLTRDGETLVHRAVRLAAATAPQRLMVVIGACESAVLESLQDIAPSFEALRNPRWSDGMAGSLQVAADALRDFEGVVLILACDQPCLESRHLQRLLDGAALAPASCAATRHGMRRGVPAVVTPALLSRVHGMEGDAGLGSQLTAMDGVWTLDAPELAHDLDTPDDVAHAKRMGWLDP